MQYDMCKPLLAPSCRHARMRVRRMPMRTVPCRTSYRCLQMGAVHGSSPRRWPHDESGDNVPGASWLKAAMRNSPFLGTSVCGPWFTLLWPQQHMPMVASTCHGRELRASCGLTLPESSTLYVGQRQLTAGTERATANIHTQKYFIQACDYALQCTQIGKPTPVQTPLLTARPTRATAPVHIGMRVPAFHCLPGFTPKSRCS